jgi:hypothetical protein
MTSCGGCSASSPRETSRRLCKSWDLRCTSTSGPRAEPLPPALRALCGVLRLTKLENAEMIARYWLVLAGGALLLGCRPSRAAQSAGHVGCQPGEVTISDETVGHDGFYSGTETWVAECSGRRFICTENMRRYSVPTLNGNALNEDRDVSCMEEYSSTSSSSGTVDRSSDDEGPVAPARLPPASGGGFELGSSVQAARTACEDAGHEWQQPSLSQATCSDAAQSIGVPTPVEIALCSGSVCRITLVHQPQGSWLKVLSELRSKLESKYGPPGTREGRVPENCRAADAFVACLEARRVRLRYGWTWGAGQSLLLLVGIPLESNVPAIRITYAGKAGGGKLNESAL